LWSTSKKFYICFFLLLVLGGASVAEKYVKPGGSDSDTGTDEAHAWETLTYASTTAVQYETIHVLAGTYSTLETFPISLDSRRMTGYGTGLVTIDASGRSQITVNFGGTATLEGFHRIKNTDRYAVEFNGVNSRVISCTIETTTVDGVCFQSGGDNCSLISCEVSGGAQSTLYFASGATGVLVRDCMLVNTKNDGYVVYPQANSHNFILDGNTIRSSGSLGYGILFNGDLSGYSILNNAFICENPSSTAAGMWLRAWGEVSSNEVRGFGTGILVHASASTGDITIEGNTIVKCGTGVQNDSGSVTVYLNNNIISAAPDLGYTYLNNSKGIVRNAGTVSAESNCVWNNERGYSGLAPGPGDITACPRFVDVANDDYRLYSDSPCLSIDAGRYGSVGSPSSIVEVSTVENETELNQAATLAASTIVVKAGSYSISAPIELGNNRRIVSFGNGQVDIAAGNDANTLNLGVGSTIEGVKISSGYSGKYGVYAYGSDNLISGSTVEAASGSSGIYLDGDRNLVSASSVEVDSGTNAVCINGSNNMIAGCGIRNSTGSTGINASSTAHYTTVESSSVGGANDNSIYFAINALSPQVLNCDLRNTKNGSYVVHPAGSTHNFAVKGSTIRASGHGIYHDGSASGFLISGNTIVSEDYTAGDSGMRLPQCCGLVVSNEVRGFDLGIDFDQPLSSNITVDANTIVKCKTGIERANSDSYTVFVRNCIISSSPEGGAGISGSIGVYDSNASDGYMDVAYSDVYGNATDYSGTITLGSGTISAAALFADTANDDYTLTASSGAISPCIDSGDPASPPDPDGSRRDMGAYPFNWIGVPPIVKVTTAESEVSWEVGSANAITWTATQPVDIVDHIDIDLSADGGSTYAYNIVSGTENDGYYEWEIAQDAPRTTQAKIRIHAIGSLGTAESDSVFTIFSTDFDPPTLEVTAPTTGETLGGGGTYNITWSITDESGVKAGSLNLYYSRDGGANYPVTIVSATTESDNSYPWIVAYETTSEARIKIEASDNSDNLATAESGVFSVDASAPGVSGIVLSDRSSGDPNYTDSRTISVEAQNVEGNPAEMILSLNIDFIGASWRAYQNPTTFEVGIGDGQKTVYYKLRDAALNPSGTVWGSIVLDTVPPLVIVNRPATDECFAVGSVCTIEWEATDATSGIPDDGIDIYYSTAGGADGYPYVVTVESANVGSYIWSLPEISSECCCLRLVARDRTGNVNDGSGPIFGIESAIRAESVPPSVVISVNGVAIKSGDFVPPQPTVKVVASDNLEINSDGVRTFVDGNQISVSGARASSIASVEVEYVISLVPGTHSVRVEATDAAGNTTTKEAADLKVAAAAEEVKLTYVIAHPSTFKPKGGEVAAFSYVLNKDADIRIYLFSSAGSIDWNRRFPAGTMGGQAGYNMVEFSGISDISGAPLANGIYVFKILAGNRLAGKGYIVVYD